jgi:REP element-mobilizing transposase RayT
VEYPGAIYHVTSRGDQRDDIFLDDLDRHDFIRALAEACQKTGWQVRAYCLMRNHYHLVLETPDANLVSGMAWLQSTCTIRLNNRHRLTGHVLEQFRQAWCIGAEAFRRECLQRMEDKLGENHPGQTRLETAQAKADRIVTEELARLHWTPNDLLARQRSDPAKLALAARLRQETTLSIKEIAERLHLGKPKGAKTNLHKFMNNPQTEGPQIQLDIG